MPNEPRKISEMLPDAPMYDNLEDAKEAWFREAVLRTTSFRNSDHGVVHKTLQESLVVLKLNDDETHRLCYDDEPASLALLLPENKSGHSR